MTDNQKALIWLNSLPKIGAVKIKKLVEQFGEPKKLFNASPADLVGVSCLTKQDMTNIMDPKLKDKVGVYLDSIYKNEISIVTWFDDEYPELLKRIYDPPTVLFYKGTMKKSEKCIAIVGSRRATSYGVQMAETIARGLLKHNITVVSGLARGVDSYAHSAVVNSNGRTIAVLGCGVDVVYPRENARLYEKIIENGAIISEYLPGAPPMPSNFPARNRIISGLSQGVIVIEAGEKSGSLITADFALEQGREVFAVPGNVSSGNSVGTNRLIREGAKIITSMQDILDEMKYFEDAGRFEAVQFHAERQFLEKLMNSLDKNEQKIVHCLQGGDIHIDELLRKSEMSMADLNSSLIMLELNGVIEQKPGKIYALARMV